MVKKNFWRRWLNRLGASFRSEPGGCRKRARSGRPSFKPRLEDLENRLVPATVQFNAVSESVSETAGMFSITVTQSAATATATTIPFTLGGTATPGTDYSGVTASPLVIAAGQTSATITGNLLDDNLFDTAPHTLTFTLSPPINATLGPNTTNTLTLTEDSDVQPTVQFSVASESINESAGTFSIPVTLSAATEAATTVPFTLGGTAVSGTDYSGITANPLVIAAGQTTGTITGTVLDDNLFDTASRTLTVTLGTPTNATLGASTTNTLTLTEDSDAQPTVQFSAASESVNESAGTFSIPVTLSAATDVATTVPFTLGGTAVSGTDYNGVTASPLVIPAGQTTGTITGALLFDGLPDATKTLTLTLGTPTNATLGATTTNTLTIAEAAPTVQLSAASESLSETAGTFSITVMQSAASSTDTTIPFTLGGTSVSGTDYSGVTASPLVIHSGQTSATITGTIIDDNLFDTANRTLIVTLGTPTNATLGATTTNTLTLTEDSDAQPTVQFSVASESINESAGTFSIPVTLSAATEAATTVPFTLGGTAVSGTDYSGITANPLVIAAGQTTGTITGTVLDDNLFDTASRTLTVTLGTPTNATLGASTTNTLTLTEDSDPQPTVQFSAASESVNESAGTFSISVTLSATTEAATTVPFTLGGTAVSGTDYSGVTTSPLVIPAGQTTGTITGALIFDGPPDASKTLTLTLGTPTNAMVGATASNTLTIAEGQPTVQFSTASESVNESAGTFSIPVTLSAASAVNTSIPFTLGGTAVAGTDYSGVTASPLVIPAGQTTGTITGALIFDGPPDASKTLTATLGTPTNATLGATTTNTLTIAEAAPSVQFSAASESINESAGTFSITVTQSALSGVNTSIPFTLGGTTVSGTDFSGVTASPLVILAGQTSATITGTIVDDNLFDAANRTLTVTLGTPTNATLGATATNTLTLTEDSDAQPTVQFSAASESVNESAGTFSIAVTLSAATEAATTVPFTLGGTAVSATDYSGVIASPLVIAAGQTTGTITGTVLDDNLFDTANRTLTVTLGTPTNATLGATTTNTLTLTEDSDTQPTVQFSAASESVNESAGTFSIPVTLSAASEAATSVPFTLGGTAVSGTDYSGVTASPLVIPAGQTTGTITGALIFDGPPDASKTLTATLGTPTNATLGATTTNTLTIAEGQPTVQFSAASESINESAGTFSITITQSGLSSLDTSIPFTLGGTAATGTDYSGITASPLVIPAGQTTGKITGTLLFDGPPDASKTLTATLGTPTNATLGATTTNTLTIAEGQPTVQFSAASESLSENAGTFSITVTQSAVASVDTSIPFTLGGTAVSGIDYSGILANPVVIPAGQTTATITGTLIDDGVYGSASNKTLTVTLGTPSNATLGTATSNTLTINETSSRPSLPGLTAQERFVQAMYLDELGRAGATSELDSWVALLNSLGGSQGRVASAIALSSEGRDYLVKSWYSIFLSRQASNGEEMPWVNLLLKGQTEERVLSQILGSAEFYQHAQTLVATGSADERYVQALYQLLLNRTGSASEVAGWTGSSLPAQGRQSVALAFLQTGEYRTNLFRDYYNALLHRPDDAPGLNGWVLNNLDASSVRTAFETSSEFFTNG